MSRQASTEPMNVVIPEGAVPGQAIEVTTASGARASFVVPEGAVAGESLHVTASINEDGPPSPTSGTRGRRGSVMSAAAMNEDGSLSPTSGTRGKRGSVMSAATFDPRPSVMTQDGFDARSTGGNFPRAAIDPNLLADVAAFDPNAPGGVPSLAEDPTLDTAGLTQEALETMDHELFEPLDTFDKDLREMMIDTIDEKVRRILALDPSKFKDGKLPFGLRPPVDDTQEIGQLRAELKRFAKEKQALIDERDAAIKERNTALEENRELFRKLQQALEDQRAAELLVQQLEDEVGELRSMLEAERSKQAQVRTVERERPDCEDGEAQTVEAWPTFETPSMTDEMSQTMTRTFTDMQTQAKLRQQEKDSAAQTTENFFNNGDTEKLAEEMERRSREASEKLARLQEKLDAMAKEKEQSDREMQVQKERLHRTAQVLYNTLGDVTSAFNFTDGDGHKAVEGIVGKKKASEVGKLIGDTFEEIMPAIDAWASETVGGVKAYLAKRGETAVSISKLQKELDELRKRLAGKEDELARLLLTIDELRLRLSKVRHVKPDADTFQEIGLEEFIDDLGPTQLRGVFERLYEDAVQRISRSNLVLHHLMTGKRAFAKLAQDQDVGFTAALQQLNETVSATLKGMWYNSEYVFRHVCQYAMEKGAEESFACKDNTGSVTDFLQEELFGEEDVLSWQQRPPNRLPGRRGEQRPSGANGLRPAYPGTLGGAGKTLWHPMPGGVNPPDISPRQMRKKHLVNPESNPFTEYVASLREARGEAPSSGGTPPLMRTADDVEWHRSDVRAAKSEGTNALPNITFINRPADFGGGKPRSDMGMGKSASLPALPRRGPLGGSY